MTLNRKTLGECSYVLVEHFLCSRIDVIVVLCTVLVSDSFWPKDLHSTVEGSASQEGTFPLDDIITTSDWASGLAKDEADLSAPVKPSYSVTRGKNPLSRTAPKLTATSTHQSANNKKVVVNSKPDAVSDSNSDFYDVFGSDSENDTGVDEPVKLPVGGNKSGVSTDEDFEQFVKREVTNGEEELQKAEEIFQKAIQSSSIESKRSVDDAKLNSGSSPSIKKLAGDGGPNKGPKAFSKKPTEDLALTRFKNTGRKGQRRAHVAAQVRLLRGIAGVVDLVVEFSPLRLFETQLSHRCHPNYGQTDL